MHSSQWAGRDAPALFGRAVNGATKCLRVVAKWSKTSGDPECCYETPSTHRLRALRLYALARGNKVVNAIHSSITQAPDGLVKELMDVHGWPAHEALCGVQLLQQDVLDDMTEKASA